MTNLDPSFAEDDSYREKIWPEAGIKVGDIKLTIGLAILMGVVKKPSVSSYWSTESWWETPFFREYQSRNVFQLILSKLHVTDDSKNPKRVKPPTEAEKKIQKEKEKEEKRKQKEKADKVKGKGNATKKKPSDDDNFLADNVHDPQGKVRHITNVLQHTFRTSFTPGPNVAIDEQGCKFRGIVHFRQYNSSKPDKYHIKLYAICDSDSGYICGFEIYGGEKTTLRMAKPFGSTSDALQFGVFPWPDATKPYDVTKTVMQMLYKYRFLDQYYTLYCDNYYTSFELLRELLVRKTYCCGTVRDNRYGYPLALRYAAKTRTLTNTQKATGLKLKTKNVKRMQPKSKEIGWRRSIDHKYLAMLFSDRKYVALLSSCHQAQDVQLRGRFEGQKARWRPEAVHWYNMFMKGVDHIDQELRSYELHRKSLSWPKKLFFHMVNMAIQNAYILFEHANPNKKDAQTSLWFRSKVIKSLLQQGLTESHFGKPRDNYVPPLGQGRYTERHFPSEIQVAPNKRKHRKCSLCHTKSTKYQCVNCNGKKLCAWPCFESWHTPGSRSPEEARNGEEFDDDDHQNSSTNSENSDRQSSQSTVNDNEDDNDSTLTENN